MRWKRKRRRDAILHFVRVCVCVWKWGNRKSDENILESRKQDKKQKFEEKCSSLGDEDEKFLNISLKVLSAFLVNQWMRSEIGHGTVSLSSSSTECALPDRQLVTLSLTLDFFFLFLFICFAVFNFKDCENVHRGGVYSSVWRTTDGTVKCSSLSFSW
jgi:hypothetical protein